MGHDYTKEEWKKVQDEWKKWEQDEWKKLEKEQRDQKKK